MPKNSKNRRFYNVGYVITPEGKKFEIWLDSEAFRLFYGTQVNPHNPAPFSFPPYN